MGGCTTTDSQARNRMTPQRPSQEPLEELLVAPDFQAPHVHRRRRWARVGGQPAIEAEDLIARGWTACPEEIAALSGGSAWRPARWRRPARRGIHKSRSTIQVVDRAGAPPLLPIFRSRQQVELLALLLGDRELEVSLSELAERLGTPYPSVHREIERAEAAGLVLSRKVGNTRLVRANTASPYFDGLAQVLTRAFGVPAVLAEALRPIDGITSACVYGSWAARFLGSGGQRGVQDIDLLVLGEPDRDQLYAEMERVEARLGRPVHVTIRDADWLTSGEGLFHDTVVGRPMVPIPLEDGEHSPN